jgi:hypothetical protein
LLETVLPEGPTMKIAAIDDANRVTASWTRKLLASAFAS